MTHDTDWAARLRRIAAPVLANTPVVRPASLAEKQVYADTFADEAGHRRVWDAFLLARLLGLPTPHSNEPWLWSWLRVGAEDRPAGRSSPNTGGTPAQSEDRPPGRSSPPFFADPDSWSLEQETEKELAGLHAWSWLIKREAHAEARSPADPRFDAAVEWTLANIQPDNATNHPWAIHVYLARPTNPTHSTNARMYAETMLHNCLVTTGQPDLVSALILWDAANWLMPEA